MAEDRYYKSSDQILTVERSFKPRGDWSDDRRVVYIFDFEFRTMSVITNYSEYSQKDEHSTVVPFSSADPAVLERMHDKLKSMGGKPDPVSGPRETKPALAQPRAQKGLNP